MSTPRQIFRTTAAGVGALTSGVGLFPTRRLADGVRMKFDLRQSVDAKIFYTGQHEPETLELMRRVIQPGFTVIDVGANIGYFSIYMAKMTGPEGRVVAFEPSGWTYAKLRANVALNDLRNVEMLRAGAGSETLEAVDMVLPCGYRLDGTDTAIRQSVRIRSIDDHMQGARVDFIKTDTDGWESDVLAGAAKTLAAYHPQIIFELAPDHCKRAGHDAMGIFRQLSELGYRFFTETDDPVDPRRAIRALPKDGSMNIFAKPA